MALPAALEIRPDLGPAPGRPATAARIDGRPIAPEEDGSFVVHLPPGDIDLTLRHAQDTRQHCVTLAPCAAVRLTSHGAQLARHTGVRAGACDGQPASDVAVAERTAADAAKD